VTRIWGELHICFHKTIIELNSKMRAIVWGLQVDGVRHANRIDNGNLLIITGKGFMEVEPDGTEVWSKEIRTTSEASAVSSDTRTNRAKRIN